MLDLEQIKEKLQDRKTRVIADKSGLNHTTVWKVKSGKQPNPTYAVLKALSDYFESQDLNR